MTDKLTDEQLERHKDIRAVLELQRGRRFVWRLIEEAGVFSASFDGDALTSAYTEGKRAVGIELMREIQQAAPEHYLLTLSEALKDKQALAAKREEALAANTLDDE